ncbi:hypothetical protein EDD98_5602 [Streptomyces sp. PanSC19]|uniref:hypothetical protein n=1 Tax=Streptomyces sp. PanSC19 TaxID=1520455 RepID=UPI000F47624D|nr:hypothetical protein [Streptomyces sp. PanSC19]ROQ26019.1 hypothetical protein EDD98_5602 [Streptomyces sp. PanSC19]
MTTDDQTPSYYMVEDDDSVDMHLAERVNEYDWDSDTVGTVTALFPAEWSGGQLAILHGDGSVALDLEGRFDLPEPFDRGTPRTMITTTDGMAVLRPDHPANQTIESGFQAVGIPVPDVVRALNAREAAIAGDKAAVHAYTTDALNRVSWWNEPISDALLGNWADPLYDDGRLTPDALKLFLAEAKVINNQRKPIWAHETNRQKVRLLDTPLGEGMTLYDVLSEQPADDLTFEGFEDPRLIQILKALTTDEREVVMCRSLRGITNWPEAAMAAGHPEPAVMGEHVRRKVKRLVKQPSTPKAAAR